MGANVVRIETGVDGAAAAAYAAATALVLHLLDASNGYIAIGAAIAFAGCFYGLRSIEPEYIEFDVARFEPQPLMADEAGELVLTDADRLPTGSDEPLVLDEILAELAPDSRVVRLFDAGAMPTPGELKARIDGHRGDGAPPADASEALHEALAQLRRSLA